MEGTFIVFRQHFIFRKSKRAANASNVCAGMSAIFPSALLYIPQIQDGGQGGEHMRGNVSTRYITFCAANTKMIVPTTSDKRVGIGPGNRC